VLFLSPDFRRGTNTMKIADIKDLTVRELETRKRDLRHEIFNLRIQQQAGQLEKPHMLRTLRRDAARVETALTAKRRQAA
jgi:large subunit ribosomal protein L29